MSAQVKHNRGGGGRCIRAARPTPMTILSDDACLAHEAHRHWRPRHCRPRGRAADGAAQRQRRREGGRQHSSDLRGARRFRDRGGQPGTGQGQGTLRAGELGAANSPGWAGGGVGAFVAVLVVQHSVRDPVFFVLRCACCSWQAEGQGEARALRRGKPPTGASAGGTNR